MSQFTGFSEEDLKRIKCGEIKLENDSIDKKTKSIYPAAKKKIHQYKSVSMKNIIDDAIDDLLFDKCRLSLKTANNETISDNLKVENKTINPELNSNDNESKENIEQAIDNTDLENGDTINSREDVATAQYSETDLEAHRAKLEELQLQQRLMEEQNKKRKEMLSKALADRTRQTEEEVMRLEKIKKELQVLDGQFTQDVGVLRKKIDVACLTYAETEKQYLRVEKEFLEAKMQLQKAKEKKELLTEHLCALITHNETRKAQKLETLMLELATNKSYVVPGKVEPDVIDEKDESPIVVDGVDQRTGKMVEFNGDS